MRHIRRGVDSVCYTVASNMRPACASDLINEYPIHSVCQPVVMRLRMTRERGGTLDLDHNVTANARSRVLEG